MVALVSWIYHFALRNIYNCSLQPHGNRLSSPSGNARKTSVAQPIIDGSNEFGISASIEINTRIRIQDCIAMHSNLLKILVVVHCTCTWFTCTCTSLIRRIHCSYVLALRPRALSMSNLTNQLNLQFNPQISTYAATERVEIPGRRV